MKRDTVILHMDADAFFVGVEIAKNPKLRNLPVVTGEERGIVSALSYEAKTLGVKRGMPIFQLKKEFPNVKVLPGDYKSYVRYSALMFDIVRRYADDVEEYSIDECFAELTGLDKPLKMNYRQIAEKIKSDIKKELKISVSIGLAPTKCLAKVASKWDKPNGLIEIKKPDINKFLREVKIEDIWGIGFETALLLRRKNISSALDFVSKDIYWIKENLSKPYETIWRELKGDLVIKINPKQKEVYSSIQKTRSFHPATNNKKFLFSQISKNIEDSCLKARLYKLYPKKVSIFLKTKNFEYKKSQIVLSLPTNAPEILINLAEVEFEKIYNKNNLYRTTGVVLQDLISFKNLQTDLFDNRKKLATFELIHERMDSLEKKFGKRLIHLASTHDALINKKKGTDSDADDRNLLFL